MNDSAAILQYTKRNKIRIPFLKKRRDTRHSAANKHQLINTVTKHGNILTVVYAVTKVTKHDVYNTKCESKKLRMSD